MNYDSLDSVLGDETIFWRLTVGTFQGPAPEIFG